MSLLFFRTKCSSSGSTHSLYRGTCSTRQRKRRGLLWRYGWGIPLIKGISKHTQWENPSYYASKELLLSLPPPLVQLHMILSPFGHQCSKSSETSSISSETGDGPPQKIPEPSISAPEEEEENLSDTDSESEWDTPGPVNKV